MNRLKWYVLLVVSFFLLILLLGSCSTSGISPRENPTELLEQIVQASNRWKDIDGSQPDIILEYPNLVLFIKPKAGYYCVVYRYWNALTSQYEWSYTPWIRVTADFRQYMDMRREEMLDPYEEQQKSPWMKDPDTISLSG